MLNNIVHIVVYIASIFFFIYLYKDLKPYFKFFKYFSFAFLILSLISLLLIYYVLHLPIDIEIVGDIFKNTLIIFSCGTTGIFILGKNNLPGFSLLKDWKKKNELIFYVLYISLTILALLLITSIFLLFKDTDIYEPKNWNFIGLLYIAVFSFIFATEEEIVYRTFVQSIFCDLFKNLDYKISILFSSLFFTLAHGIFTLDILRFCQLYLVGIFLGYLMFKRGIESTILAHFLFNFLSILIFRSSLIFPRQF